MNDNLDTARDILEKALEPLLASFAGDEVKKGLVDALRWPADLDGFATDGDSRSDITRAVEFIAAREEKQKEAIKALDIEKLIKLIREA